jgi:hypothetical protein
MAAPRVRVSKTPFGDLFAALLEQPEPVILREITGHFGIRVHVGTGQEFVF